MEFDLGADVGGCRSKAISIRAKEKTRREAGHFNSDFARTQFSRVFTASIDGAMRSAAENQ
jgi:hypothetical protein